MGVVSKSLRRLTICCLLISTSHGTAAACDSPEHRAFDFWLGDWQVHTPDGKLAGHNVIEQRYAGCVIHEQYSSARDFRGESLNIYDASRKVWHQTWVDNSGLLLTLEGGIRNGAMVMQGETTADDGKITRHRITWTPNKDGSVRQLWESMETNGKWETAFDGLYTKKGSEIN